MTVVYAKRIITETTLLVVKRKLDTQTARTLLAIAMEREYGIDISKLDEQRDENGKPYFKNCDVKFNISHSKDWAICALSDNEVGVDIEKIVPISLRVMWRFFKNNIAIPKEQVRLWTRYESYGKFIGTGIPVTDFNVPCFYREYDDIEKYYVTVCSSDNDFCDKIIILD